MSIENTPEARLFGFRISKTGTIILAFLSLTFFIQYIPQVYFMGQSFLYYLFNTPIIELLTNFGYFIQGVIALLIPLTLVSFLITIFILCARVQKSFRTEDIYARWFSYRLTKNSIAVLFILSLIFIIIDSFNLYNSVFNFIFIITHMPLLYVMYYIILIVAAITAMVIHIYTLIICVKNRETLP